MGHIVSIGGNMLLWCHLLSAVMVATLSGYPLVIHSSLLQGQAAGFSQPYVQLLLSKLVLQQLLMSKLLLLLSQQLLVLKLLLSALERILPLVQGGVVGSHH